MNKIAQMEGYKDLVEQLKNLGLNDEDIDQLIDYAESLLEIEDISEEE